MTAYLERLHATLARSTVQGTASELAHFGRFLARHDPCLASLALLDRQQHVEPYLNEVAAAVNHRTGTPIAASTAKQRIQAVGSFLDAIAEWGWPEAPARRLIFPRDAPKLPHPLPRYLPPDQETGAAGGAGELAGPAARRRAAADCAPPGCASASSPCSNWTACTRSPARAPG